MSLDMKLQPFQVLAEAIASEIDLLVKYPDYYAVEDKDKNLLFPSELNSRSGQ